ncbi:MAG: hypothetical protein KIT35_18465 [Piscinibacter sp.]|uniref:hypothetical protein n=1 Tax=Piscinibacter sp. TaxID=1903157 RepID=UPI0025852CA7|nr:hypothetical protein [Piscinibacter sp.]MCW5665818.1 hypothetical protein [Piscinibacter sp.]
MSVTIGEFEVVPQPPAAAQDGAAAAAAPGAGTPDPLDLQRLLEQLHEQALRVAAD